MGDPQPPPADFDMGWHATIHPNQDFDVEGPLRVSLHCRHRGVNWHIGLALPPSSSLDRAHQALEEITRLLTETGLVGGQAWSRRDTFTFPDLNHVS